MEEKGKNARLRSTWAEVQSWERIRRIHETAHGSAEWHKDQRL